MSTMLYRHHGDGGLESDVLVPLGMSILMYLAAAEPDLNEIAPEQIPQQLKGARVMDVGWRIGSVLRTSRQHVTVASDDGEGTASATGWRLPPHFRRAHWHRVRVATRDESGAVIGDRLGELETDWSYELRWYPPTPVNVDKSGPAPAVRDVTPNGSGL